MNKIVRNIPNAITCANLLCGCLAIVKAFEGDLVWAAYLVGIAAALDFLDGFIARALNANSPIGKDLDSLADMVTFGVVPGVIMYKLLSFICPKGETIVGNTFLPSSWTFFSGYEYLIPYIAFLIPVFSAIRLARFNNDTRQTDSFIGLPTPANAIFFCSFPLITKQIIASYSNPFELLLAATSNPVLKMSNNPLVLSGVVLLFCFLLIAPLPLFSLKFKGFKWKGNQIRFAFLGIAAGLIGWLQFMGIPLVIILYILLSIINNLVSKRASSN